ncbi:hypothetical protein KM043_005016 [Ampulex compressa]|nr:hypothetical protein KM043_005016 [Ampulex compressa]
MVTDYFAYKEVHKIVGFSCGSVESDFKLAKALNDVNAYTSMLRPNFSIGMDVQQVLRADYQQLGIFLDTRCDSQNYTWLFSQATEYSMYDDLRKWLIIGASLNQSVQLLNDETFTVATDVVIAIPASKDYILYDVYNPCKERGGKLNVTLFGKWSGESGLIVSLQQPKFERRSNLHGMRLKVGIITGYDSQNTSLEDTLLEYDMKEKYGRSKFLYMLLTHMSDMFNFTMDIVQINTQRRFDDSGPVFAALQRKLIDLSASPVMMRMDRSNHGDLIGPVWPIRSCFLFRTISSTMMKTEQFLRPLSTKVWYVVLSLITMAILVLKILLKFEGLRTSTESYGLPMLITIGALSQQGSTYVPSHYAGRIAFLHIMFFSLLMINYYSASVVSDRLKNIGEKMNDSLISLSKSNLKIAAEPTPYIRSLLQVEDEEVRYFYQKRWSRLPQSSRYVPLQEGLNRVATGTLAYHTMVDSAYPYIEKTFDYRSICELTEVHLFRNILAFYARHKSPFTELLKIGLTKIQNMGLRQRQLKRWSARKPFCPNSLLIAEPLSIHEAAPLLIFLSLCTSLSIILCIIENMIYWIWPTRESNFTMEQSLLIGKNMTAPLFRHVNLQALKNLNFFKNWRK